MFGVKYILSEMKIAGRRRVILRKFASVFAARWRARILFFPKCMDDIESNNMPATPPRIFGILLHISVLCVVKTSLCPEGRDVAATRCGASCRGA